jgi:thiol-disulfide isomerase/thioredoxin
LSNVLNTFDEIFLKMKKFDSDKSVVLFFLKKHWSNILFFGIVALFIIPPSRIYLQSKIAFLFSTSPTIIESRDQQNLSNYNLILKNINGDVINLNQSKGKPIFINFWATWCAPCLAEMPALNELYENNDHKVDFYFISEEDPSVLKHFLKSKQYNLPVYNLISEISYPLENDLLPSTYLIDGTGKIVATAQKSAKWNDSKIQKLIENM